MLKSLVQLTALSVLSFIQSFFLQALFALVLNYGQVIGTYFALCCIHHHHHHDCHACV